MKFHTKRFLSAVLCLSILTSQLSVVVSASTPAALPPPAEPSITLSDAGGAPPIISPDEDVSEDESELPADPSDTEAPMDPNDPEAPAEPSEPEIPITPIAPPEKPVEPFFPLGLDTSFDEGLATPAKYFIFGEQNTITGYTSEGEGVPTKIIIPETYTDRDGVEQQVLHIASGAFAGQQLQSVKLNSNLQTIGASAFETNALNQTELLIPDGIKTISDSAFKNAGSLGNLVFGDGSQLESIGVSAFEGATLAQTSGLALPSTATSIGERAFYKGGFLGDLVLPDNMTVINKESFFQVGVTSLVLPSNLLSIKESAFENLNLGFTDMPDVSISLPAVLNEIDKKAFYQAAITGSMIIPSTVTLLGDEAFAYSALSQVEICGDRKSLIKTFQGSGLESAIVRGNVNLLSGTFSGSTLESVQLIGNMGAMTNTFGSCTKLTTVEYDGTVSGLYGTFTGCHAYTDVHLPSGLNSIGDYLFGGSSVNRTLTITNLDDIPATNPNMGINGSWYGTGVHAFYATGSYTAVENFNLMSFEPGEWSVLRDIWPPTSNVYWKADYPGCFYLESNGEIIGPKPMDHPTHGCNPDEDHVVTINAPIQDDVSWTKKKFKGSGPWTVFGKTVDKLIVNANIGRADTFSNTNIQQVEFGPAVTMIPKFSFYECSKLERIILPEGLLEIGERAFESTAWSSITIPGSMESIDLSVFFKSLSTQPKEVILSDGVIAAEGSIGEYIDKLIIPTSVTRLGLDLFDYDDSITKLVVGSASTWSRDGGTLVIPDTVLSLSGNMDGFPNLETVEWKTANHIPGWNFFSSGKLTSVTITGQVKMIGDEAFRYTPSLRSIYLQNHEVNSISGAPWGADASMVSIYWKPEAGGSCFRVSPDGLVTGIKPSNHVDCNSPGHRVLTMPNSIDGVVPTAIAEKAFMLNTIGVEEIHLADTISSVGKAAFSKIRSLKKVTLPGALISIGDEAFLDCIALEEIVFAEGVDSVQLRIGKSAFAGATSLKNITLPSRLLSIGDGAFRSCTSLEKIAIPEGIDSVGDETFFNCTSLEEIIIPEGVDFIGGGAFLDCASLKEIVVPEGVKRIGQYSFANCTALEKVTLPSTLRSLTMNPRAPSGYAIDAYAFEGCTSLKEIVIPEGVDGIGFYAFSRCESLESITLPSTLRILGIWGISSGLFQSCDSLKEVIIPEGVELIGESMFSYCPSLKRVQLPQSLKQMGNVFHEISTHPVTRLDYLNIPPQVTKLGWGGIRLSCAKNLVIDEGRTVMGNGFLDVLCSCTQTIKLPESLTDVWLDISEYTSEEKPASLKELTIPTNVKSLHIEGASVLEKIVFKGEQLTTIHSLRNAKNLKNINLPKSLTTIESKAFSGSGLTELELPSTLDSIAVDALENTNIEKVYINQLRSACATGVTSTQPWGSSLARENIFYRGEYIDIDHNIEEKEEVATINLTITAEDGGLLNYIEKPDGTKIENIARRSHSFAYPVQTNGNYEFAAYSSALTSSGRSVVIPVSGLSSLALTANDFEVSLSEVPMLDEATILRLSDAQAIAENPDAPITLSITPEAIAAVRATLIKAGDTVDVLITAEQNGVTKEHTITIQAVLALSYSVTYDANGGTGTLVDAKAPYTAGSSVTVLGNAFDRKDYTFTGWNTAADGGGTSYNAGSAFSMPAAEITLYAQWKAIPPSGGGGGGSSSHSFIDIIYHANNATSEENIVVKNIEVGSNITIRENKFTAPDGKRFVGWSYTANGTLACSAGEQLTAPNKDVHLYAIWIAADIPSLNRTDHSAYIKGYPSGDVKPEQNISREEVAVIFYRLLDAESRKKYHRTENGFTDINTERWSMAEISTLANAGILVGYEDKTFRPDAAISRAEFAAIAARFDDKATTTVSGLSDIAGHWAESYINRAAELGWVNGYTDKTFRPENHITRAEAMKLVNDVLNRHASHDGLLPTMKTWEDNADTNQWYYLEVQEATNTHEYTRKGDSLGEQWTKIKN